MNEEWSGKQEGRKEGRKEERNEGCGERKEKERDRKLWEKRKLLSKSLKLDKRRTENHQTGNSSNRTESIISRFRVHSSNFFPFFYCIHVSFSKGKQVSVQIRVLRNLNY